MHIIKILEAYFKTDVKLVKESDNAYTVVRHDNPESTRYALLVNSNGTAVIHDRKEVRTKLVDSVRGLPDYKANPKRSLRGTLEPLFKKGTKTNHPYLEGLHDLMLEKSAYTVVNDTIVAFYTNYIEYPSFLGAKTYPDKLCKKGSIMKGSYCVHSYSEHHKQWAIGEGLKECVVAAYVLEDYNVIEAGGLGNIQNILKALPNEHTKLLLGENDSIEAYKKLVTLVINTSVVYPIAKHKDFADQFKAEKCLDTIKSTLQGQDIRQETTIYKALGVRGGSFYIYIARENIVYECNDSKLDFFINLIQPKQEYNWLEWKSIQKKEALYSVRNECALVGQYNTDNEYGVGLWSYNQHLLYNTGSYLYKVKESGIRRVRYSDYLKNDFLLVKKENTQPKLRKATFDPIPLMKAFQTCDWEYKSHGKVLLGFLMQSYYAGVIAFRPNLWLMSDSSSAGKTWLTSWIKRNLTIGAIVAESGKTTPAGLRQLMADYSTLLFVDEFGEANSPDKSNTFKILEMFRSTATGTNKVVLGTASQKPISQRLRLSAMLSCINGLECVEEQDYERLIFIRLLRKDKSHFYNVIEPAFNTLPCQKNFASYSLSQYHKYVEYLPKMLLQTKRYLKGHRIRGLASILAGYSAYMDDEEAGNKLLVQLLKEDTSMFEPFRQLDESDIILKYFTTIYNDILTLGVDSARLNRTIYQGILRDDLSSWGVKIVGNTIAVNPTSFYQFILKLDPANMKSISRSSFRQHLKQSLYIIGKIERVIRFKHGVMRCLLFDKRKIDDILNIK